MLDHVLDAVRASPIHSRLSEVDFYSSTTTFDHTSLLSVATYFSFTPDSNTSLSITSLCIGRWTARWRACDHRRSAPITTTRIATLSLLSGPNGTPMFCSSRGTSSIQGTATAYDVVPCGQTSTQTQNNPVVVILRALRVFLQVLSRIAGWFKTQRQRTGSGRIRSATTFCDDLDAFKVVIDLLYVLENNYLTPSYVNFSMLHRIAVLIHRYQWHAVLPQAKHWFNTLVMSQEFPRSFDATLMRWLWVAWLLERRHEFNILLAIAQYEAPRSINPKDNPRLPAEILGEYCIFLLQTDHKFPRQGLQARKSHDELI